MYSTYCICTVSMYLGYNVGMLETNVIYLCQVFLALSVKKTLQKSGHDSMSTLVAPSVQVHLKSKYLIIKYTSVLKE